MPAPARRRRAPGRRTPGLGAQRRAGSVERDVASAHDDDALAELGLVAAVDVEEELDGAQDSVEIVTGQIEVAAPPGADGDEERAVLVEQVLDRGVVPDAERELDFDPELDDGADLAVDERAREAVLGDAEHHHSSQPVGGLVDRDRMTREAELVGGCEAGGAAADHADRGQARRRHFSVRLVPDAVGGKALDTEPLGDEALEGPDRYRSVDSAASTGRLARSRAHPPADRSERVRAPGDEIRVAERPSAIAVT